MHDKVGYVFIGSRSSKVMFSIYQGDTGRAISGEKGDEVSKVML